MVIVQVTFETELSEDEVVRRAEARIEEFRALPGLLQKYYIKLKQPNHYGGIYVWDSMESLAAFRQSELAKSIPGVYQVKGQPSIQVMDAFFPLRESAR